MTKCRNGVTMNNRHNNVEMLKFNMERIAMVRYYRSQVLEFVRCMEGHETNFQNPLVEATDQIVQRIH